MRSEKMKKYEELDKNTPEFEMWFLNYNPQKKTKIKNKSQRKKHDSSQRSKTQSKKHDSSQRSKTETDGEYLITF